MHDRPLMPAGIAGMITDAFNRPFSDEDGFIPRPWFILWAYPNGILSGRIRVGGHNELLSYHELPKSRVDLICNYDYEEFDDAATRFVLEIVIGRSGVLRWPLMALPELLAEIAAMALDEYTPRAPMCYGDAPQPHETEIRAAEKRIRILARTQGLSLRKSRVRNRLDIEFGTYALMDPSLDRRVLGSEWCDYGASLLQVGEYLDNASADTGGGPTRNDSGDRKELHNV